LEEGRSVRAGGAGVAVTGAPSKPEGPAPQLGSPVSSPSSSFSWSSFPSCC